MFFWCLDKWQAWLFARPLSVSREQFKGPCKQIWVTSCQHLVCLQCLSLPSWAACMFVFGFVGNSLAATSTDLLLGQFRHWKCLTPGEQKGQSIDEVVAGESGLYNSVLDIRLFLHSSSDISITVPNCCLSLTVSCYCQWKVSKPLALRQLKQPVSGCCVRDSQLHAGLLQ